MKCGKDSHRIAVENMLLMFLAAYDTTALTISNSILMLAMHPEKDEKMEKELFQHYTPGDVINQDLFKNLPYLDAIVKEVLRLFPPAPLSLRKSMEDTGISMRQKPYVMHE